MWCTGRVCVGSEHALILNLLIKWACQVGVCPISACTGPSKQHIPPIGVRSPLCLNKKRQKNHWLILCYYSWLQKTARSMWIFQAFIGCFQRSRTRHPFICTVGSLRGSSLWSSCSCSAPGHTFIKMHRSPIISIKRGIPSVATTSKKKVQKRNIKAKIYHHPALKCTTIENIGNRGGIRLLIIVRRP